MSAGEIALLALLGLGIAAAGFVLTELCVRAWLARFGRYYVWQPYSRTHMQLDRETLPTLEVATRMEFNSDGERGDPPPSESNGTFRVLVAGGSVAECYFVDQENSWPYVVQRVLSRKENLERLGARRVHVGNIGRSLVTCRHIEQMLARLLPRYPRLDAIVFMVGASDLVHWLERRTPEVIDEPEPKASQVFAAHPEGPFGWTVHTLALRRVASYWRRRLMRPIEVRERAGKRLGQARAMRARAKEILHDVPDPKPFLDHFEHYLRRLVERARIHAPRVIIARQPWLEKRLTPEEEKLLWNFGAGRPYEGDVSAYYSHELVWRLMKQVDQRTSDVARELGVQQVDVMPRLESNFEIYYDELHFTPKGCALVGQVVAQAILDAPVAASSASPVRARGEPHAHVTQ